MASQKGMSTGLRVAVVAIVILIVAVVVLGIFTGGIQGIAKIINSWLGGGDTCEVSCNAWKLTCNTSMDYNKFPGCNRTGTCDCTP
jgi:hypothetical protein